MSSLGRKLTHRLKILKIQVSCKNHCYPYVQINTANKCILCPMEIIKIIQYLKKKYIQPIPDSSHQFNNCVFLCVCVFAEWQMSHSVILKRSQYHKQNVGTKGCSLSFTAVVVAAVPFIDKTWLLNGAARRQ